MNTRIMTPTLLKYSIDEKWQEDEGADFGISPNIRWVVHFEITLADKYVQAILDKSEWLKFKARHVILFKSKYNSEGALGELFGLTICSPAFKDKPSDNYLPAHMDKALILNSYDEAQVVVYINNRLQDINDVDADVLYDKLDEFLEMDD